MYIFMNSFMTGVNDAQNNLAFSSLAHIRIYNDRPPDRTNLLKQEIQENTIVHLSNPKIIKYTDGIKNSREIESLILKQPGIRAIAPQVNINVFFRNAGNKINGTLSGVDVVREDKVFQSASYMTDGKWNELGYRSDGIFVGIELAKNLSLKTGDYLNILTSDGVSRNYKVMGIFRTNFSFTDKSKAYISIAAARQLLAVNQDYVTDVQVDIADYHKTSSIVAHIAPLVHYKIESWQSANQQLEAASKLRDIIAIAVSLTILIVAGFGIYNIMNMTINEKIREIAILKAMGFAGADVTKIFLTQAIIIGIAGGLVGMTLGYLICIWVNHIPFKIAGLETLPVSFLAKDYAYACAFGLITTLIAGYLPARKASKIDPVTIIRG
jgi:lipoprotein-releasing system permease protein